MTADPTFINRMANFNGVYRPRVVEAFGTDGMGYLIQETPEREYRYIAVEAGEDDVIGDTFPTMKDALQDAVADWRENGEGDLYAPWCRAMAAAAAEDSAVTKAEAPQSTQGQHLNAAIEAVRVSSSMRWQLASAKAQIENAREVIAEAIETAGSYGALQDVIDFELELSQTLITVRKLHTDSIKSTEEAQTGLTEIVKGC